MNERIMFRIKSDDMKNTNVSLVVVRNKNIFIQYTHTHTHTHTHNCKILDEIRWYEKEENSLENHIDIFS